MSNVRGGLIVELPKPGRLNRHEIAVLWAVVPRSMTTASNRSFGNVRSGRSSTHTLSCRPLVTAI